MTTLSQRRSLHKHNLAKHKREMEAFAAEQAEQAALVRAAHVEHLAQEAAFNATCHRDFGSLKPGDYVRVSRSWHRVLRVNAKSVTVPSIVGGSWTDRIPNDKIIETRAS